MSPAETLSALVQTTPASDLPALAAELARASANLMARIATAAVAAAAVPHAVAPPRPTQELLTVEEAAKLMNVKVSWLYRHARELAFAKKIGRRTLRFQRSGIEQWIATRPKP